MFLSLIWLAQSGDGYTFPIGALIAFVVGMALGLRPQRGAVFIAPLLGAVVAVLANVLTGARWERGLLAGLVFGLVGYFIGQIMQRRIGPM